MVNRIELKLKKPHNSSQAGRNLEHSAHLSFRPPWYLRSGHVQTILTAIYRPKAALPSPLRTAVRIGTRGSTYIYRNTPTVFEDPIEGPKETYVLLHGLGSCHAGSYMTGICGELLSHGHQTIRVDTPGAGPSQELTDLPPHAGTSDAILEILRWVAEHWGIRKFRLIGFSLGGNIALHLASYFHEQLAQHQRSGDFQICSIHALAPPIDLAHCCRNMERGVNRMYATYFLKGLRRSAQMRANLWPNWQAHAAGFASKTIRSFDETVTAPMAGFAGANVYYAYSSVHERLHQIQVPTTIVADLNDPIVPYSMFSRLNRNSLANVKLLTTRRGGHLGYYQHRIGRGLNRWADQAISQLILRNVVVQP